MSWRHWPLSEGTFWQEKMWYAVTPYNFDKKKNDSVAVCQHGKAYVFLLSSSAHLFFCSFFFFFYLLFTVTVKFQSRRLNAIVPSCLGISLIQDDRSFKNHLFPSNVYHFLVGIPSLLKSRCSGCLGSRLAKSHTGYSSMFCRTRTITGMEEAYTEVLKKHLENII